MMDEALINKNFNCDDVLDINVDNKIRINKYISEHPNCQLDEGFPVLLHGNKKLLTVYLLPIDLLIYNVRNGRFAAEYKELIKREGGHLQPEKEEEAIKIRELLLNLEPFETKRTSDDLKVRGQWNCGIITEDGYVIDGNRRMSIISKLYDDTGLDKWKYLKVALLKELISPQELWMLEASLQLGKDEIVRYGPINDLLKLREGVNAGLTSKAIIDTLYGYESEEEVKEKLRRLDLIEQYLKFMGIPEKYSKATNSYKHFIHLQDIIKSCNDMDYEPERIVKIKYAAFQLIKERLSDLELKKIHQIIEKNLTDAISEIEMAGNKLKPIIHIEKTPKDIIREDTEKVMDEFDDNEEVISETRTHFINATDVLDVSNNEGKEFLLLNRAEKNLRPLLDYRGTHLSTPEAILVIKKIVKYSEELKEKYTGE